MFIFPKFSSLLHYVYIYICSICAIVHCKNEKRNIKFRYRPITVLVSYTYIRPFVQINTVQALHEAKKNVDAFTELYDILLVEDKLLDKGFKREFHDVSAVMVEQLYKLFRKRPRWVMSLGIWTSRGKMKNVIKRLYSKQ